MIFTNEHLRERKERTESARRSDSDREVSFRVRANSKR